MRRGLIFGIGLWAVIALGFKLVVDGDIVTFEPDTLRLVLPGAAFGIALFVVFVMQVACAPGKAMRFGLGLAIPGMLLGSATLLAYGRFIARPSLEHGIVYAVFTLWTYGLILAGIALFGDRGTGAGPSYGRFENPQARK